MSHMFAKNVEEIVIRCAVNVKRRLIAELLLYFRN